MTYIYIYIHTMLIIVIGSLQYIADFYFSVEVNNRELADFRL